MEFRCGSDTRAARGPAPNRAKFYCRCYRLLHWRRDCFSCWDAIRQDFCAVLAPERSPVLRASGNAAAGLVDFHPRRVPRTYCGRAAGRNAVAAIAGRLCDKLLGRGLQCLRRAAAAGRAAMVRHHPQSDGLCFRHRLCGPGNLRLRRCLRANSWRRGLRRLRIVLGALVRIQCAGQSYARPDRDDLP